MPATIADEDFGKPMLMVNQELPDSAEARKDLYLKLAKDHESVILRVARRLCAWDRDLCDDIVQESLIAGYVAFCAGRLPEVSAFRAWILRIVFNRYLVEARKLKRVDSRSDVAELIDEQQEGREEPEALRNLLQADLVKLLELSVSRLQPDHQAVIILIEIEEFQYDEAATALGVPIGTIRSRLARARLALAETMTASQKEIL